MLQEQFWKEFWRTKVQAKYVELHLARTETIDRGVKVSLALTSSASIGGWVIWKDLALLWGTVIAASQVLNAVRQFLPYKERLRSLISMSIDLEELVVQVEDKWLRIAGGELTEEEMRKALLDLRTKRMKSFNKHFHGAHLPERKKLLKCAEESVAEYFHHIYSTSETS